MLKLGIYTPETYDPNISYGAIKEKLDIYTSTLDKEAMCTPYILATIIADIRASKLPDWTKLGTAGSFFKNPYIPATQFEQLQKDHPEVKGWPVYIPPTPSQGATFSTSSPPL